MNRTPGDIVERLRKKQFSSSITDMCKDAADEIKRLRNALEIARKQLGKQVTAGGPYPYINGTELVCDSRKALAKLEALT